jgi:hypothetical protein
MELPGTINKPYVAQEEGDVGRSVFSFANILRIQTEVHQGRRTKRESGDHRTQPFLIVAVKLETIMDREPWLAEL